MILGSVLLRSGILIRCIDGLLCPLTFPFSCEFKKIYIYQTLFFFPLRYQCRLLFANPIAVNATQVVTGVMQFNANKRLSYDINVELALENTTISTSQKFNLVDQHYHYW